ncbi:MAG: hypothetical protein K0S34_1121 [Bacillales bacterium]|jgi:DNA-dependent RNA polymerase auxiliary subunit epsilon|nr:hypothetical protein [Bacillales bacterium]
MYFKVYYQEKTNVVAVREMTKTLYVKASSIVDVQKAIAKNSYNIEHIEEVNGAYLEYEKTSTNFKLLELDQL